MAIARLVSAAAQTATELVAAPGSGKVIEIYGIFITSVGTNTVSLHANDGSTLLHRQYNVTAHRGQPLTPGSQPWDVLPENKNLTITSTAAETMFVKIVYRLASV